MKIEQASNQIDRLLDRSNWGGDFAGACFRILAGTRARLLPSHSTGMVIVLSAAILSPHAMLAKAAGIYREAPEFRTRVMAGSLPPVEQRLPRNPVLLSPVERIGRYGGTWHITLLGYDHTSLLSRTIAYENLVRWDPYWTKVIPNLAQSWEVKSNATVFVFKLRPGTRWSDGAPFTSEDVKAWFDDVVNVPELTPIPPSWLVLDGRTAICEVIDPGTIEFRFAGPNAIFIQHLASMRANALARYPQHYFRKFHVRHNPDGARDLVKRTGATNWADAFQKVYAPWDWVNPDAPTLDAWVMTTPYKPGTTPIKAVRNPYYWKVDTQGNQLPYIDGIEATVVADQAQLLQRVLDGRIDMQSEGFDWKVASPQLLDRKGRDKWRPMRLIPSMPNMLALCLNLAHPDPIVRSVFTNKAFRVALSEAIDRKRIIKEVLDGRGKPWQIAPRDESSFRHEKLGVQFTQFNPRRSAQALDELELKPATDSGIRRLRDGRTLEIEILLPTGRGEDWITAFKILEENWRAIGVGMKIETLSRTDFYARLNANRHDAAAWWSGGGITPIMEPEFFVPVTFERIGPARVPYGVPWAAWFTDHGAANAQEPPPSVRRQMEIYRKIMGEPDQNRQKTLMRQVLDIAAEEFYAIGLCQDTVSHAIVSRDFRNVPEPQFDSWTYPTPAPANPCQFFFDLSK